MNLKCTVCVIDQFHCGSHDYGHLLQGRDNYQFYRVVNPEPGKPILDRCQTAANVVLLEISGPEDQGSSDQAGPPKSHQRIDLLQRIRAELGNRPLPIIVIGENDVNLAKQALKAGAADYLVREQISADTLDQSLQQAVRQARTAADFRRAVTRHDHQRVAAALRASEAKYRSLFDSMEEGFCILQVIFDESDRPIDYRHLETNPAFQQQTGLVPTPYQTVRELVPDIQPLWIDIFGQVALTGEPVRLEDQAQAMGQWFDVSVFRIGDPQERQVALLFSDVTQRKRREANAAFLTDITKTFAHLLTADEIMQSVGEKVGTHLNVSNCLYAEIDTAQDQIIVKHAWHSTDAPKVTGVHRLSDFVTEEFQRAGRAGETIVVRDIQTDPRTQTETYAALNLHAFITVPFHREGEWKYLFSINDSAARDWSDDEVELIGEITHRVFPQLERARAEAELSQLLELEQLAREAAEQANRIKDEFLAILSHELRSPLHPILGWVRMLQSHKLSQDRTQQALSTIERNAKLQTQLIDDLLNVAKTLRGKFKLNETKVDLSQVVTAAMDVVKTAAAAKSIFLDAALDESCWLKGDEVRLQQIVWNLLSNAIKFTPSGGRVEVRLEQISGEPAGREAFTPRNARLTVTDTGKGISPDFLPHLFKSFRQEDTSQTRHHGGLGLGLSIVKYLVDAHGGSIVASSPGDGKGATFIVQLPLSADEVPSVLKPRDHAGDIDLAGTKVLAVDDNQDSRDLIEALLAHYGAEVGVVASGFKLLSHLNSFKPDVLVCDISMPDLDGYSLIQQVRRLPTHQGGATPAIALTAHARQEDCQRALDYGFQQHITKPYDPEKLVSAIAELARNRGS